MICIRLEILPTPTYTINLALTAHLHEQPCGGSVGRASWALSSETVAAVRPVPSTAVLGLFGAVD